MVVGFTINLPWSEIIGKFKKICKSSFENISGDGIYETLDYESTLKILKPHNK
jgi:hypothetical protein